MSDKLTPEMLESWRTVWDFHGGLPSEGIGDLFGHVAELEKAEAVCEALKMIATKTHGQWGFKGADRDREDLQERNDAFWAAFEAWLGGDVGKRWPPKSIY